MHERAWKILRASCMALLDPGRIFIREFGLRAREMRARTCNILPPPPPPMKILDPRLILSNVWIQTLAVQISIVSMGSPDVCVVCLLHWWHNGHYTLLIFKRIHKATAYLNYWQQLGIETCGRHSEPAYRAKPLPELMMSKINAHVRTYALYNVQRIAPVRFSARRVRHWRILNYTEWLPATELSCMSLLVVEKAISRPATRWVRRSGTRLHSQPGLPAR